MQVAVNANWVMYKIGIRLVREGAKIDNNTVVVNIVTHGGCIGRRWTP